MNGFQRLIDVFMESLRVFGEKFMETIPGILIGILVIVIAWLFARLISTGFEKLLQTVKFDNLAERFKITDFLKQANITLTPSAIIGRLIYWILVLLIVISASEALGWTAVSYEVSKLLSYIPNLVTAVVFFAIGAYLASFVRDVVRGATSSLGISTGRIISSAIYYLLFVVVALTSMEQLGINTSIISSNLLIIIGSIMLAASISYGYASRDVLANILAGFFNKRTFQKGQTIEIDGIRVTIVEMSNIAVTIQVNENEKVVVPSHQLMNTKVKIIK